MTNNTINVPRELLENIVLCYNEGEFELGTLAAECHALLSAPSPAGVDGLEVVAWQQRYIDPDEGVSMWGHADARSASILKGRSDYELRPLYAVPPDAQAIIDGLRGEVCSQRVKTCTALKERNDARAERDQQAQRIGELEGLLIDIAGMFHGPGIEGGPLTKLLRRIDAALSAGKEDAQ